MASIYGISIKNLVPFRDHEGATIYQGDVYRGKKKLGFWSMDSWGGDDIFDFPERELSEEVARYKASDYFDEVLEREGLVDGQAAIYEDIFDASMFLYEVLLLKEVEELYQKTKSKMAAAVVAGSQVTMVKIPETLINQPDEEIKNLPMVTRCKKTGHETVMVIRGKDNLNLK